MNAKFVVQIRKIQSFYHVSIRMLVMLVLIIYERGIFLARYAEMVRYEKLLTI